MKVYYCPKCKRKIPYDKKYALVICKRCQEEMFELQDGKYKDEYIVEVKE